MDDLMTFPDTVEEFMEQYKITDTEQIYTNGTELVPIFRMKQWFEHLPSAEPERAWHPVEKPPAHHKDVIVRGVEAIGNVTVHKVMQWDVDTWRPTNYAPSITWTEWSEI